MPSVDPAAFQCQVSAQLETKFRQASGKGDLVRSSNVPKPPMTLRRFGGNDLAAQDCEH